MATTTADMGQLTKDKQTPANAATHTLEERLAGAISYHQEKLWRARLADGADITLSKDDMHPAIVTAILFYNTLAFDTLLQELVRRKANLNAVAYGQIEPALFIAAGQGDLHMVEALLEAGANPHKFNQATVLTSTLEHVSSRALVEPRWSRWRYENEPHKAKNAVLTKQMSDFFWQKGDYTPPTADQVIPFAPEDTIHVHFKGKLSILSTFLANNINVSPLIPLEGTTRSPLELVQHPSDHPSVFDGNPKEALKYIGTEAGKPHILLFEMTFANKRLTGTIPTRIIVHYNFKYARRLIETVVKNQYGHGHAATAASLASKVEEGLREAGNRLDAQLVTVQTSVQAQLTVVQSKLSDVHGATTQFTAEMKTVKETVHYDEKQEIERFKLSIKNNPNAEEAYNTILSRLKSIHKSAQAVAGGGVVVSEGSLGLVAKVLDVSTELVDAIPLVGAAASKFFGLAASATRQVDGIRQTNIYENIAAMVPPTGAGRIFESVARKLTIAYLPKFQLLQTREEAQTQVSSATGHVQNALKSRFKSPAERVAAFAIIWMIDDVFNNMHQLENELKKPNGLETLLLNVVTQRKPEQGVETFWNTIIAKLGMNQIPTRTPSGAISTETCHPADFWTRPGVMVQNSQNSSAVQYFAGNNNTNPTTTHSANSKRTVMPPPSPTVTHAYPLQVSTSLSSSTTCSPSSPTQTPKPELKPVPPAPKRNKSPAARLRACLFN